MFDRVINITDSDRVSICDGNENEEAGCGTINDDGHLYFIRFDEHKAYQLPDCYKDTPLDNGGYHDGYIMVSLMGHPTLRYYEPWDFCAGIWGWLDEQGEVVIPPQYIFSMPFIEGYAIVSKGTWQITKNDRYWSDDEQWGVIDHEGHEVIPCRYDDVTIIEGSSSLYLCHKDGWEENGKWCIFDLIKGSEIVDLDFSINDGYSCYECFFRGTHVAFVEYCHGSEEDILYAFNTKTNEWDAINQKVPRQLLDSESQIIISKGG